MTTERDAPIDLATTELLELPAAFDAHVHLRDGDMARLVAPTVRKGGVNACYVMVCMDGCVVAALYVLHLLGRRRELWMSFTDFYPFPCCIDCMPTCN